VIPHNGAPGAPSHGNQFKRNAKRWTRIRSIFDEKAVQDQAVFANEVTGSEIEVTFEVFGEEVRTFISCQS